jgi:hypothetical protein
MDAHALLVGIADCLIDEGGYPRFTVAHGRDFDAAALALCRALYPDEWTEDPEPLERTERFTGSYADSFAA